MSIGLCYPLELWLFYHYDLNMAINYHHYDPTIFSNCESCEISANLAISSLGHHIVLDVPQFYAILLFSRMLQDIKGGHQSMNILCHKKQCL